MLHDFVVIAAAFGYISFLFLVASYGDRLSPVQRGRAGVLIYPLSLAIYCTSWTFFGSVGFATRTSVDFLAIYLGPIVLIGLCTPLLRRRRTSPRSPTSSAHATARARRSRQPSR
jgi:Na+/proline symporter